MGESSAVHGVSEEAFSAVKSFSARSSVVPSGAASPSNPFKFPISHADGVKWSNVEIVSGMTLNAASAFLTRRTVFLSAASKDCAVNVNLEAFNGKDHMRIVDLSNGEFHGVPPVVGLHQRSRCARLATAQGRRGSPSPPLGADKFARASVRAALNEKRARATASVEFGGFCGFRDGARSRIV